MASMTCRRDHCESGDSRLAPQRLIHGLGNATNMTLTAPPLTRKVPDATSRTGLTCKYRSRQHRRKVTTSVEVTFRAGGICPK